MVYDAFGKLVAEYGTAAESSGRGVKYVQQDRLGSVRAVTNGNGFVIARADHQAFGDAIGAGVGLRTTQQGYMNAVATRPGYALTESDVATGQRHTWFRKLETQAGRWTGPDPYNGSIEIGDPQSLNRYSYVGGDPANFIDPSGLIRYIERAWDGSWPGWMLRFMLDGMTGGGGVSRTGDGSGGGGSGVADPPDDNGCQRFAALVQEIANGAADAAAFMQALINKTIGASTPLNAASKSDFQKAVGITGEAFSDSGFKEKFVDNTGLQVRHFVGGLWAGYLYGPVVGLLGMNYQELGSNLETAPGNEPDVRLNSVSVRLGSQLIPTPEGPSSPRQGVTNPAKLGYKGLAAAIRNEVCE